MARNQKRETVELHWHRVVGVVLAVVAIAVLTVGYVLQRRAHDELGRQIKATESNLKWKAEKISNARVALNQLLSKAALQRKAAEMQLGLTNILSGQRRAIPLLLDAPSDPPAGQLAATNRNTSLLRIRPLAAAKPVPALVNR